MQLTAPAALAGAADTAAFLAKRPQIFRESPGRAAGSVVVGGAWLALAVSSAAQRPHPGARTIVLAGTLAAANAALLAVHLRHGVAGPRVFAGAGLATVALADALRRR